MQKSILTIFISLITTTVAVSQWKQTGGPEGANTKEIVKVGSALILSAENGGIYKSLDNGDSWILSSSGLPCNESVRKLVEQNGILYASVTRSGIYRSDDEGENWFPINSGIENLTFYGLYVNGDNIYTANANGGVYISMDNGISWSYKSNGIPSVVLVNSFVVFNSRVYAAGHPNSSNPYPSLYETSDNGNSWTGINIPNLDVNGISSMIVFNGSLYVADYVGHIFTSSGSLSSWTQSNINIRATITSMNVYGNTLYCTTSNGRYYYTTDGVYWSIIQNTNTINFADYLLISNNKIIMSTNEGLYESFNNGASWTLNNSGISALQIRSLNFNNNYLFAGSDRQGIFRSSDNGLSWTEINNGLANLNAFTIFNIVIVGNYLFISTYDGVYVSTNNGDTWIRKFQGAAEALDFNNGVLVVAGSGKVYISTDLGQSWASTSFNVQTGFEAIQIIGNTIVLATRSSEIYISDDLGNTWTNISTPNGDYIYDILYSNTELYASTNNGLMISDDLGSNWTNFNNDSKIIQEIIIDSDVIYAATATGMYATNDCLNEWYPICDGIGEQWVNTILLKDDKIFAGTFTSSVWERSKLEAELILTEVCPFNSISLCSTTDLFDKLNGNPKTGGAWSPSLASGSGLFDPSIDASGVYTYTYHEESDYCDCEKYQRIEVTAFDGLDAGLDSSLSLCSESETVDLFEALGGNPDEGGAWNPNLASGSGVFDPKIDAPGIYTYTVTNENCGVDSAEINVIVSEQLDAGLDGQLTICTNDSIIDLFTILGGSPDSNGTWSPSLSNGSGLFDPSIDQPGIYTYTVGSGECEAKSEVVVEVLPEPNSGIGGEVSLCANSGQVNLFDFLEGTPDSYGNWSPALSSGTSVFDPLGDSGGIYSYTVENNCGISMSQLLVLVFDVSEPPNYNISINELSNENSITVNINSNLPYEYSLDNMLFQESNVFKNLLGGTYTIYGREINGCGFFQDEVTLIDYPKFFTPNGDGFNDFWQVRGVSGLPYSKIFIYDRYGKLLKELSATSSGWDGSLNGTPMPSDDYWFSLYLEDGREVRGHFALKL